MDPGLGLHAAGSFLFPSIPSPSQYLIIYLAHCEIHTEAADARTGASSAVGSNGVRNLAQRRVGRAAVPGRSEAPR
jgi:hypothetical protein